MDTNIKKIAALLRLHIDFDKLQDEILGVIEENEKEFKTKVLNRTRGKIIDVSYVGGRYVVDIECKGAATQYVSADDMSVFFALYKK